MKSFFYTLLLGFLLILSQLVSIPVLASLWGHSLTVEILVLIFVFIGFLFGVSGKMSEKWTLFSGIILVFFSIGMSFSYTVVIIEALSSPTLKYLLSVGIFMLPLSAGKFLADYLFDEKNFDKAYGHIHLVAAGVSVVLCISIKLLSQQMIFLLLGFVTVILLKENKSSSHVVKKIELNRETLFSICMGTCGSILVSCFFLLRSHSFHQTGLEFYFYLFWTNIFLFVAAFVNKKLKQKFDLDLVSFFLISSLLFFFICLGLGANSRGDLLIDPLAIFYSIFPSGTNYNVFTFFATGCLLLPYLLVCLAVPRRQTDKESFNHLFFVTAGNIIGHFLMVMPFLTLSIHQRMLLFLIICLSAGFLFPLNLKSRSRKVVFTALLAVGFILLPNESNYFSHLKRTYYVYWAPKKVESFFLDKKLKKIEQTDLIYSGMNFNNLVFETSSLALTNQSGFLSETYLIHDFFKQELILRLSKDSKIKKPRILIMGLGNHLVLKAVEEYFKSPQIEVVDMDSGFRTSFRELVAKEVDYVWEKNNAKLIFQDAFQFVFSSPKKYDYIFWNLNPPSFPASTRLYTQEFQSKLKEILKPSGILISNLYHERYYDCNLINNYPANRIFEFPVGFSIGVFSREIKNNFFNQANSINSSFCEDQITANLNQFLAKRVFDDGSVKRLNSVISPHNEKDLGLSILLSNLLTPRPEGILVGIDRKKTSINLENSLLYPFDHFGSKKLIYKLANLHSFLFRKNSPLVLFAEEGNTDKNYFSSNVKYIEFERNSTAYQNSESCGSLSPLEFLLKNLNYDRFEKLKIRTELKSSDRCFELL